MTATIAKPHHSVQPVPAAQPAPAAQASTTDQAIGHFTGRDNRDNHFTGPLEPLPLPTRMPTAEEGAQLMHSDGCVQFPDLFSTEEVRALRAWIDRSGKQDASYEMPNWCFNKHLEADLLREQQWLELMDRDPVPGVLERVLGPGFICYGGSLWVTGRGRQMPMHADFLLIELPGKLLLESQAKVPVVRASLHIYLDDQVEEIGPTLVIPGSHRAGHQPQGESTWNGVTPKMASVKAGGAVLFRHDLWHGAGMNSSTRRRYMIQVHYAMKWHHGPQGAFTAPQPYQPELLEQTTARQRRMLGEAGPDRATKAY